MSNRAGSGFFGKRDAVQGDGPLATSLDEPRFDVSPGASPHGDVLRQVERAARAGSFVWEPPGIVSWSDGLFELFGYEVGSVIPGQDKLLAIVHPEDRARVRAAWEGLCDGRTSELDFRRTAADSLEHRYLRLSARVEWDGDYVERVRGVVVDVTEAKRSELALEEALHRADVAEQVTNTGSFMLRVEPMEMTISEGLKRVTGLEHPNADAATHLQHVYPDDRERQKAWWDKLVRELSCDPLSIRMLAPGGGVRHLDTRVAIMRSPTDGVERVFGTTMDVTERVELEGQVRHAAKMEAVGTLAAGVAHDFNNYLMVVESSLCGLEAPLEASERSELARGGRQALHRCIDLTRQLLAIARRQPFRPECVDLRQVVSDFWELLVGVVGRKAQAVLQLDDTAVMAWVDPRHAERIAANLMVNAAEAIESLSPRAGRVEVSVRSVVLDEPRRAVPGDVPAGRYACLVVADDGAGIAVEDLLDIFEPYFTTKGQQGGTGLGLSSVYGMVRQNGGHVTVRRLERGTEFCVYFPESVARVPQEPLPER